MGRRVTDSVDLVLHRGQLRMELFTFLLSHRRAILSVPREYPNERVPPLVFRPIDPPLTDQYLLL
jgi:hypothetical protein